MTRSNQFVRQKIFNFNLTLKRIKQLYIVIEFSGLYVFSTRRFFLKISVVLKKDIPSFNNFSNSFYKTTILRFFNKIKYNLNNT